MPDTFTNAHHVEITPLAARYRLPATYPFHFFAEIGELMSIGVHVHNAVESKSDSVESTR